MAGASGRPSRAKSGSVSTLSAGVDWAAVTAAISSVAHDAVETPPPDWFTAEQYAERADIDRNTAQRRLNTVVKAGRAETKKYRIVVNASNGRVYPVTHYRVNP